MFYDEVQGKADGIIAPVKGLNTLTALAGLSPGHAIQLDNWICQPDAIVTRPGSVVWATGFANAPKTLVTYSSATANKMFAMGADGIREVSTTGVAAAASLALTTGQGSFVNFATSAGQFGIFVNGVDEERLYNGTAWVAVNAASAPAITGQLTSSFTAVESYRARLYYLQKDFLGFTYLPSDSIGGLATQFRIGNVCRLGGFAVAMGTWSVDGGAGPDDHFAIATSNGEIVVYHGSDPSVAANWTYFGTFYVGKPLGVNSFAKFGGDLLYLCENGLIPLSSQLQSSNRGYTNALSNKIQPSIAKAVAFARGKPGWKVSVIPRLSLVLINVPPQGPGLLATQFVYNSFSKAWSTFSGWDIADFTEFNNEAFFTQGLTVVKAFTGQNDLGNDITAICDTSYNRFGTRSQLVPSLLRVLYAATNQVSYSVGLAQDFSGVYEENGSAVNSGSLGFWNSGLWDLSVWGGDFILRREWLTITSRGGLAISTRFKVSSKAASTILLAIDYKFVKQGLVS